MIIFFVSLNFNAQLGEYPAPVFIQCSVFAKDNDYSSHEVQSSQGLSPIGPAVWVAPVVGFGFWLGVSRPLAIPTAVAVSTKIVGLGFWLGVSRPLAIPAAVAVSTQVVGLGFWLGFSRPLAIPVSSIVWPVWFSLWLSISRPLAIPATVVSTQVVWLGFWLGISRPLAIPAAIAVSTKIVGLGF